LHVKHWANQLGLGLRKSHLKGPKLREAFLEALVTRNMEDIISALSAPGYLLYVQSNHHLPTLQRGDAIPANIHALTVSTVHDVEIGTIWNVIFRGNTFQGSFMHFAGDKKYRLIRSSLREVMTIGSGSEYCLLPGEFKAKVLGSTALPDPCADFAAKVKCRARIGQSISAVLIFAAIFGPLAIVYIVLYYLKGDEKAIAPTPPPGICDNHVNILVGPLVNGFCDFLATTSGPGGNSFYPNTYAQVGYQGNFSDYPSNWVLRPGNALTLINGAAGSLKTEVDCLNPVGCSGAMFPADEEGRSCEVRVPFTCGGTTSIPFVAALLQIARTVGSPTEMIAVSATLAVLSVAAYAVGRVVGPVVKSGFSAVFHQSSSEQSDELQPEGRV
jgi:hypothetical protein